MVQFGTVPDLLVLVLNSGSSSIKFALYKMPQEDRALAGTLTDVAETAQRLDGAHQPDLIGHRLVHGGPSHSAPQLVTQSLISDLRALIPLAPNHLPRQLDAMEQMANLYPAARQVACFDTAFHRRMPPLAQLYALPEALRRDGMLQRYGFHGLSYEYICAELSKRNQLNGRVVICHLGNGASMAAVRDGQPIDTTMGLTPTGGLVMSTRCGDLDPEVVLFLMEEKGLTVAQARAAITEQGGMLGISGISGDMRELHARELIDPTARMAIDAFCYSACKAVAALSAALGGLDRIVFTGGIGENDEKVRLRICEGVRFLGPVQVDVIPTNEELMIARHAAAIALSA